MRREDIERKVKGMNLDRVHEMMVRWIFKQMLLKRAPSMAEMESMIAQTPFGKGRMDVGGIGFQIRLKK